MKFCKERKAYLKDCKFCKQTFYGRLNKLFCDDVCKYTFNNNKSRTKRNLTKVEISIRELEDLLEQIRKRRLKE